MERDREKDTEPADDVGWRKAAEKGVEHGTFIEVTPQWLAGRRAELDRETQPSPENDLPAENWAGRGFSTPTPKSQWEPDPKAEPEPELAAGQPAPGEPGNGRRPGERDPGAGPDPDPEPVPELDRDEEAVLYAELDEDVLEIGDDGGPALGRDELADPEPAAKPAPAPRPEPEPEPPPAPEPEPEPSDVPVRDIPQWNQQPAYQIEILIPGNRSGPHRHEVVDVRPVQPMRGRVMPERGDEEPIAASVPRWPFDDLSDEAAVSRPDEGPHGRDLAGPPAELVAVRLTAAVLAPLADQPQINTGGFRLGIPGHVGKAAAAPVRLPEVGQVHVGAGYAPVTRACPPGPGTGRLVNAGVVQDVAHAVAGAHMEFPGPRVPGQESFPFLVFRSQASTHGPSLLHLRFKLRRRVHLRCGLPDHRFLVVPVFPL